MPSQDQMIEDLSRVAELVIVGENRVAAAQKKKHEKRAPRDYPAANEEEESPDESEPDLDDHLRLSSYFLSDVRSR